MSVTLDRIRSEHLSIHRVLECLDREIEEGIEEDRELDFGLIAMALDYMRSFPDQFHHPKENEYLFKAVVARYSAYREVIDELYAEHREGEEMIDRIQVLIDGYAKDDPESRRKIERAIRNYVTFQLEHMHREETMVFPMAQAKLTEDDWEMMDIEFAKNKDPLSTDEGQRKYDELFKRIVIQTTSVI